MVDVPLPTLSSPAEFSESGGRLINTYVEKLNDGRIARKRVAGLREIVEIADYTHCRGFLNINENVLAALDNRLVYITSNGDGTYSSTNLGGLSGTGQVYFARNNKSPTPDIVAVTDSTAYLLTTSGAPASYPDADVGSPIAVCFLGGYFVFVYGNGRMRTTALNDTAINTLDTAFAESKPDGLLRAIPLGRDLIAFGKETTEIWRNTGNLVAFPFTFLDTLSYGIASSSAVAGFEAGFTQPPMFVGDDNKVYQMRGYTPTPVSNHTVERDIENLVDKNELEACVYMHAGHPCWVLSCQSWTWEYDYSTGGWYERTSYEQSRWRGSFTVKAFGSWLVGDAYNGKMYLVDPEYYKEGNDPLIATVISATMSAFSTGASWHALNIDMNTGVGVRTGAVPIETDPQCMISVSRNGGVTFENPIRRAIGKEGDYRAQIRINRLGKVSNKGFQVRIDVSDPVNFTLYAADADIVKLANA